MFKGYVFDADIQKRLYKKIPNFTMDELVKLSFEIDKNYMLSPQFAMYIMEKVYLKTKRKIIFIDDSDAMALLKMRFNAKHLHALLAEGTQATMLCLNTTFTLKNIRLYSSLNLLDWSHNFLEQYMETVRNFIPNAMFQELPEHNQVALKVVTNCKDGRNNYITVEESSLIKLMALSLDNCFIAENLTDIVPHIANKLIGCNRANETLIKEESEQVALLLTMRLTIAYYLFNQMTSNEFITKGCTKKHKHSLAHIKVSSKFQQLKMRKEYKEKCLHLRSGHYRQLVDERYYRGEHKNKPRGSRWVEVKAAVIGKADPYTQSIK